MKHWKLWAVVGLLPGLATMIMVYIAVGGATAAGTAKEVAPHLPAMMSSASDNAKTTLTQMGIVDPPKSGN